VKVDNLSYRFRLDLRPPGAEPRLLQSAAMIHVFRLGTISVAGRDAFTYAGVADDGELVAPEVAHDDATGLGMIASRLAGKEWRCEPALARAAKALGITSAQLPANVLVPRAVLAFGLGLGKLAGRPHLEVLLRFLRACATFWKLA
jgi:hypothetical protein